MTRLVLVLTFLVALGLAACPAPELPAEQVGPPVELKCLNKNTTLKLPLVPLLTPVSEACTACRASHCTELTGTFLVVADSGTEFFGACGMDFSCQCGQRRAPDGGSCFTPTFSRACQPFLGTYDACLRRECRAECPLLLTTGYEPDASVFDGGPVYETCSNPPSGLNKPCCHALATCCQAIVDAGARDECLATLMDNESTCRAQIPGWGDQCPTAAPGFDGGPVLARCDARGADGGLYVGCCADFSACCAATSDPAQRASCEATLASAGGNDQICRFRLPPFTGGCP